MSLIDRWWDAHERDNPLNDDESFDFFPEEEQPRRESNQHRVERLVGAMGSAHDASEILADPKLLAHINTRYWFFIKAGAWFIDVDAKAPEAHAIALKIKKRLKARTKLPASVPLLHNKTLYVGSTDGVVQEIAP